MSTGAVVWHDLECGAYRRDIPLWLELAREHGGPILDVGAGTGRITLALAQDGHDVVALDLDAELLAELDQRARTLPVRTVCADARDFTLGDRFSLCIVPMQTIQLLGGESGRLAFLGCAQRHLVPDGVLAAAITEQLEPFALTDGGPAPLPDMGEFDGVLYSSQPTAIRVQDGRFVLERRRETVGGSGERTVSRDLVALDAVTAEHLGREGKAAGLRPAEVRDIPPTADHVGSRVVMFHA